MISTDPGLSTSVTVGGEIRKEEIELDTGDTASATTRAADPTSTSTFDGAGPGVTLGPGAVSSAAGRTNSWLIYTR